MCHFQVELLEKNGKSSQFLVMPKYKVREEGEKVGYKQWLILKEYNKPNGYLFSILNPEADASG